LETKQRDIPAAIEQLRQVGEQVGVDVFTMGENDPVAIARAAYAHAKSAEMDPLIIDTAGRLQIDEEMMRPRLKIETVIDLEEINTQLMETLRRLAPYGPGNMRPLFASQNLEAVGYPRPRIVGKDHLKFKVRQRSLILQK
jgi:single-stranded DNA-specific DHH superfamily exonuclease